MCPIPIHSSRCSRLTVLSGCWGLNSFRAQQTLAPSWLACGFVRRQRSHPEAKLIVTFRAELIVISYRNSRPED